MDVGLSQCSFGTAVVSLPWVSCGRPVLLILAPVTISPVISQVV